MEFSAAVLTLGLNLFRHHELWVRQSGAHGESAISWERKISCSAMAIAVCYDRRDASNVAALDLMARRVVAIERAVKVNNKSPRFVRLRKMIENALCKGGGVATRELAALMATLAEPEVRVSKQNRLLHERIEHKSKGDHKGDGSGNENSSGRPEDDRRRSSAPK